MKLRIATRQTERLSNLVGNLLDVSRISAGKLELRCEPLDAYDVVRDVVERFSPEAALLGIELRMTSVGTVHCSWDRTRVEQILSNLVSNAIKYGERKPVLLSTSVEDELVRISVCDQGLGLPAADVAGLFTKFGRGKNAQNVGGLGLGLYISGQIAAAHGGHIEVSSVQGTGSTFTLVLPRSMNQGAMLHSLIGSETAFSQAGLT